MAVGDGALPELHVVDGVRLGTVSAGIKQPGRRDVVLIAIVEGASIAGVFTRNAFCAAPVQIAKRHLAKTTPRYFIINTGNANAGTGSQGLEASLSSCAALARITHLPIDQILPFSTGVIGEPLPVDKITAVLPAAVEALAGDGWTSAASGIMTTDTRPKAASAQFVFQGRSITITGIAKGAGMIKPNMATMLAYVATDAAIDQSVLQDMINHAVNQSFNRITIDGDTSTNDACMLVATAKAGNETVTSNSDALYQPMQDAITQIFIELAQGLVRDGEGATKFVTVAVSGGASEAECLKVAYTIAESPLVKTALFASDPNWGRLLAAIGRAGLESLDVNLVEVYLNGVLIAERGCRAASYTEAAGAKAMAEDEITIEVRLARGDQQAKVWTTDLSNDYVRINAEYRT